MINALCIDLEPWYSAELVKRYLSKPETDYEDQIIESITPILKLLDKHNTKATFAVLGIVAEKYPELIKNLHASGHEIASHAYSHKTLYDLGKKEFEQEIIKSIKLLENITGEKPIGFRAPSFSINNSTQWALEILEKYGFKYDASIFPIKTNLYGVPKAPLFPYRPSKKDVSLEDSTGNMIEFPNTVLKLGMNVPVTGGFYFRFFPIIYQKLAIKRINKTRSALLYIHPWETYPKTPRIKNMPCFSRFVTYYAVDKALIKFDELLRTFKFASMLSVLKTSFPEQFHNDNN